MDATPHHNIAHEIPSLPASPDPKRTKYTEPAANLSVACTLFREDISTPADVLSHTERPPTDSYASHNGRHDPYPTSCRSVTTVHAANVLRASTAGVAGQAAVRVRQSTHTRISVCSGIRSVRVEGDQRSSEREGVGRHGHQHCGTGTHVRTGCTTKRSGEQTQH